MMKRRIDNYLFLFLENVGNFDWIREVRLDKRPIR